MRITVRRPGHLNKHGPTGCDRDSAAVAVGLFPPVGRGTRCRVLRGHSHRTLRFASGCEASHRWRGHAIPARHGRDYDAEPQVLFDGRSKQIQVTSWSGTAATSAREVFLPELTLASHRLRNLKLPAIDLSLIGKACGGQIDGILGVDLLDKMGVTIDLKRQVASLAAETPDAKAIYQQMELNMHRCNIAFDTGNSSELAECFDPEIVFYTPQGEFRGRREVLDYLQQRYLKFAPNLHYKMCVRDMKAFGDALWYSYDYTIDSPQEHITGHGMSMCRRDKDRWRILNLHNSFLESPGQAAAISKQVPIATSH